MEKIVQDELMRILLATPLPALMGGAGKIFYRSAIRDTPMPYICFSILLNRVSGESKYLREGEIIFDIWDDNTVSDTTLAAKGIIESVFGDVHLIAEGIAATRIWFEGNQEAPVENNRSNRRSEDEHTFRREVSFSIRGWDLTAQQTAPWDDLQQNLFAVNPTPSDQKIVAPEDQPDGVLDVFTLPEVAQEIYYYTLGGVRFSDFIRVGGDSIELPSPPAAGIPLKIAYIPA